tara:strand:+ start:3932 stop:4924 length:993 start_codon:yes stop_codon:yes gene_type:complete
MGNIIDKIYQSITENRDVDPKLKDWIEKKYGKWHPKDFISDDGDTYFKYESTSEGGGIGHKIVKLPSFSELIKQLKLSRDAANDLVKGESVRDDEVLRGIYDEQRKVFNKFRTHLRKEYPAFYAQLKGQLTEEELDEMSTTGGGAGAASFTGGTGMQYATPYAFKKVKKEKLPEGHTDAENKKLKKISKELKAASKMHKGQAKKIDKITKENKDPGASLGPGPKASEDGVKDNAYVKQFKYSLVPKKIKGSGLEVKQLFEDDNVSSFQKERINAFDVIEQQLNDIYKMLSNAKNETSDYYSENPGSFSVIKPTDLVLDYIKDIKDLLKGE